MYLPTKTQPSCARAWVEAASTISKSTEDYNVVIDVENPTVFDEKDNAIINLVDQFLRDHNAGSISTVANTIFPDRVYRAAGSANLYAEYLKVYKKLTTKKSWGRYFMRMIRRPLILGKKKIQVEDMPDENTYNPLQHLINKLRTQKTEGPFVKAMHEIAIYDPYEDRTRFSRGGPCLSFLSFKRHPEKGLLLTAMYRNHSYITRCLGNLIGLGRLQAFVAKEVDVPVGSLTCISTRAELDTGKPDKLKEGESEEDHLKKWSLTEARKLVKQAVDILAAPPPQVEQTRVSATDSASA